MDFDKINCLTNRCKRTLTTEM